MNKILFRYLWLFYKYRVLEIRIDQDQWRDINIGTAYSFVNTAMKLKGGLIKVGQFLSARVDMVPLEVVNVLKKLQDSVDPLPYEHIEKQLCLVYGEECKAFSFIDETCLASASFGQVHKATLTDGLDVVVKIQHPFIKTSLEIDLFFLRWVFLVFNQLFPRFPLMNVFREVSSAMRMELDYTSEASNCMKIAELFKDDPQVEIPQVVSELCYEKVLVLTYLDGIKITETEAMQQAGLDAIKVMELVIKAYSRQMYLAGYFQADPHPGNLFALSGNRLGIVDFGLVKEIPEQMLDSLRKTVIAVLAKDMDAFVKGLFEMHIIAEHDGCYVVPYLSKIAKHINHGSASEWLQIQKEMTEELKNTFLEIKDLLYSLETINLPEDLVLYGRTILLLHGLTTQIAPELKVFDIMLPYLLSFLTHKKELQHDQTPLIRKRKLRSQKIN